MTKLVPPITLNHEISTKIIYFNTIYLGG